MLGITRCWDCLVASYNILNVLLNTFTGKSIFKLPSIGWVCGWLGQNYCALTFSRGKMNILKKWRVCQVLMFSLLTKFDFKVNCLTYIANLEKFHCIMQHSRTITRLFSLATVTVCECSSHKSNYSVRHLAFRKFSMPCLTFLRGGGGL